MTKHQYYLQLRKDILEERMRCDTENLMLLASLALQAEYSDYQPEVLNPNTMYRWVRSTRVNLHKVCLTSVYNQLEEKQ